MNGGYRSLNHRIHGAIRALQEQSKHNSDFHKLKDLFKQLSSQEDGFPKEAVPMKYKGKVVYVKRPISLSGVSTEVGMILMNTIQCYADENNLYLYEMDDLANPFRSIGGRTKDEMRLYISDLRMAGEQERADMLSKTKWNGKTKDEPEIF